MFALRTNSLKCDRRVRYPKWQRYRVSIMDNVNLATLKPSDPPEGPDFVTALARGLTVIRAFGQERPRMTLADIAKRVALPRATVRRSLITLETLGYVES